MAEFKDIFANKILVSSLEAWVIAQLMKVMVVFITQRKLDFNRLIGSGGMPSSHSALVAALAVSIGRYVGFKSPEFAICLVFAFIVMYDAAGVRRAAGKQARVLNTILKDMQDTGRVPEERLKELLGHTPVEVIAGAVVGTILAMIL